MSHVPGDALHARLLTTHAGGPLLAGNRLRWWRERQAAEAAICAAIDGACHQVQVAQAWQRDRRLRGLVADRLRACVARGVTVRQWPLPTHLLHLLAAQASGWWHGGDAGWLLVVDGCHAFVGGVEPPRRSPRHATMRAAELPAVLSVQGPAAAALAEAQGLDGTVTSTLAPLPPALGRQRVAVGLRPRRGRAAVAHPFVRALEGAVRQAQHRVWLRSAAFAPSPGLFAAMADAARRGVDTRLMLRHEVAAWLPASAARWLLAPLAEAGVRLHPLPPGEAPARIALVDGQWCGLGTADLGWCGSRGGRGVELVVLDSHFAAELEARYVVDAARCGDAHHLASRPRPLPGGAPASSPAPTPGRRTVQRGPQR
ncbi:phospholipase D-like domain-containing protein [Ideonella sp.]|uniref:phospholipase D-like domain-containing protein n=1 Tax=Ideonella sp. TaxID=1929293 RepID=UPI0035B2A094